MTDALFGNTDKMEDAVDSVGGGDFIKDSGIYKMGIVHAYLQTSKKGSIGVNLTMRHSDEKKTEFNTTIYMTGGLEKGQNPFYVKNGKEFPLPGFTTMNDIVNIVTKGASGINNTPRSTKTVEVYDFAAGKKLPKEVEMIDCLSKVMLNVGLVKKHVNKFKDGKPTSETQYRNEISLVMDTEKRTLREIGANSIPQFYKDWDEKYDGVVIEDISVKPATGSAFAGDPAEQADAPVVSSDDTNDLFAGS